MNDLPSKLDFPIIQEGHEIVRPDVISAVTQLAQLAQLARLRKLEESKVPIGVKPLKYTVSDTRMEVVLGQPWISFTLINDGAGAVTWWINDEADPLTDGMVEDGERSIIDCEYPVIKTIYLKAASGTTAAIRIYGKEGKYAV